MKKISILGLCLVAGLSMSAQVTTDGGDAKSCMEAGAASFAHYDKLYLKLQLDPNVDQLATRKEMGTSLIEGYDYMLKALPLDTIVNEKGKVKTKYSKKITKSIVENHNSLFVIGDQLIQLGDLGLLDALMTYYITLPEDARFGVIKEKINPNFYRYAYYYRAYALYDAKKYEDCLLNCAKANELGIEDKQLFDIALNAAFAIQNLDAAYSYAEKAYALYGKQDANYLKNIVNINVYRKEYDKSKEFLKGLLSVEPNNAECYNLMGTINQAEGNQEAAIESYKKAVELDGKLANARFNLGNALYNKAYAIDNEASSKSQTEYDKIRKEQTEPLLREAAAQLEEAFNLDEQNMGEALKHLKNIYYILGDEENLKRVELM